MDIRRALPDAWNVFFRQRNLRPLQSAAIPELVVGRSALVSAPTASGKTEAVFAPLYQRHVSFHRAFLSVVYVAPTKALVNDMHQRLMANFGMSPHVVARQTGDYHEFTDAAGRFVLLATPEALDSLQLMHPELLRHIRAVIVDELHILDGSPRGQQLRSVIARIRANQSVPLKAKDLFQVVGITATVRDIEKVSERWCGSGAASIRIGDPREVTFTQVAYTSGRPSNEIAGMLRKSGISKALVFDRSRNGAHELAVELSQLMAGDKTPVYLHIGILAKGEREQIETAMKRDKRGVCVATSTLEVGIDIGDVDVVVLAQPTASVNSFLQRIGRGNRRSDECIVWGCSRNDGESLVYRALLHCATKGYLDDVHEYWRPSVDFQQIISLAWRGVTTDSPLTRANLAERSGGAVAEAVLDDMLSTGVLFENRGAILLSQNWQDHADRRAIHSVIAAGAGVPLVDLATGEVIGTAGGGSLQGAFFAGTRMTSVRGGDSDGVYLGPAGARSAGLARLPSTRGRKRGTARALCWAMAEMSGLNPRRWSMAGDRVTTWGGADYNLLLAHTLSKAMGLPELTSDAQGISGLESHLEIKPRIAYDAAKNVRDSGGLPAKLATRFREPSAFFKCLSPSMQRVEIQNAVPWEGMLSWLAECDSLGPARS